jgi:hypothetical protein
MSPRLSNEELEAVKKWAETLAPERRAQVLWLVQEAADYRKLRVQLHDDLINEMS